MMKNMIYQRQGQLARWMVAAVCICIMAMAAISDVSAASRPRNRGLLLEVVSGVNGEKALTILQGPHVMIPEGTSPHPLLPPGPFTARISGIVRIPIRAEYHFSLASATPTQYILEGREILKTSEPGQTVKSPMEQLNKGYMEFSLSFEGDSLQGDSYVRLLWGDEETPLAPFPYRIVGFNISAEDKELLESHDQIVRGRQLFFENRCFRCHDASDGVNHTSAEWNLDAPTFNGIGSRRSPGWFAAWLNDPEAIRPNARMPRLFHGDASEAHVNDVAAYLSSLTDEYSQPKVLSGSEESGKKLFESLHCASCHIAPGQPFTYDPEKPMIDLNHVAQKFPAGALQQFLRNPAEHYASTRMPDFRLTPDESADLAAWLRSAANRDAFPDIKVSPESIGKGRLLVSKAGCLACHSGPGDKSESPAAASLTALSDSNPGNGCLSTDHADSDLAVRYRLNDADREALTAFLKHGTKSAGYHAPYEAVDRQIETLQCARCHGEHEGFPSLELMGGKLKPEWAGKFIAGHVDAPVRPWLESRMPNFKYYAGDLARGMAADYGFPVSGSVDVEIDAELAETGRKLVSATDGFACITCHAVNDTPATAVFEAPGTNLGLAGERLQNEFFTRWLLHPLKVDRSSKMPVYFDRGTSALTRYFEGNAHKQVESVWHYLLQGSSMAPPVFENKNPVPEEETFD